MLAVKHLEAPLDVGYRNLTVLMLWTEPNQNVGESSQESVTVWFLVRITWPVNNTEIIPGDSVFDYVNLFDSSVHTSRMILRVTGT